MTEEETRRIRLDAIAEAKANAAIENRIADLEIEVAALKKLKNNGILAAISVAVVIIFKPLWVFWEGFTK